MTRFARLFEARGARKVLIGVIHLPPLPGYPASPGIAKVIEKALRDLEALEAGPVDGVLVENEEDRPHRVEAARETVAAMTLVARELVSAARKSVIGVEILLNDPEASIAAAAMAGAAFIRTDYFVDPMERPEHGGPMRIDPEGLLRYRRSLGADSILILADVQVKYARMLVDRTLDGVRPARARGGGRCGRRHRNEDGRAAFASPRSRPRGRARAKSRSWWEWSLFLERGDAPERRRRRYRGNQPQAPRRRSIRRK